LYQSFCFQPIFEPRHPSDTRERIFRLVQTKGFAFQASWESHPSQVLCEAPSFAATARNA